MGIGELGSRNQWPEFKPCTGTLLIAGCARNVWDDAQKVNWKSMDIMTLNDMVMHWPGVVKHAYSNDHRMLPQWVNARRPRYVIDYGQGIVTHTCQTGASTMKVWPWPGHGTSGLNACYTGLALGYERIILAGVPLDDSGHYWQAPWESSNFNNEVSDRDGEPRFWANAKRTVFDGRVVSLSGRTRELLGGI